jgi:PKD repeat protein
MTLFAQLDLEQDPPVVAMLYDYREDPVPTYMVEPEYVDVTDVKPQPQPGYTYDGETWAPGVPQALEANRQQAAANAQAAIAANEAYLALEAPTLDEVHAQVLTLTAHVNALTKQRLYQFDSDQYPYMDEGLPGYPAPPVDTPPVEPPGELEATFEFTITGNTVQFDASGSTGPVEIAHYDWDFGDDKGSAPDGGPTVEYAYNKKGTFTVSLVVTDEDGAEAGTERSLTIT